MTAKKAAKKPAEKPEKFVRCGDCDAKLPVDTVVCPKCSYEV